jgi:hypothetical protein
MHGGMSRRQVRRLEEAMAGPLVLINTFEVSHEDAERFIATWGRGGTTLPLSLVRGYRAASGGQPNADFQFVNIGRWQTAGDFQTATQSLASGSQLRVWPGTARIWTLLAGRP